jgi:hypothetical protein
MSASGDILLSEGAMANVYEARLSSGESYTVTTDRHHGDHDDKTFKQHLLDVIKGSISGIVSGVVVAYIHKGRR